MEVTLKGTEKTLIAFIKSQRLHFKRNGIEVVEKQKVGRKATKEKLENKKEKQILDNK